METTGYTTLTRQSGLLTEIQTVAHNIANAATTGFRQEGLIFSEFVVGVDDGPSISMARGNVRNTSFLQGALDQTGGTFDLAIEGGGFFLIETPGGERLTRAGSFGLSAEGDLVTHNGHRVLDAGGAPVFIPPDAADLAIAQDGTISADGRLIGQVGVVTPLEPASLVREGGVMFRTDGEIEPMQDPRIRQGFIESSNVDALSQMARLIEVQRAYEMGQSFLDAENERIRDAIKAFIR